MSDYQARISGPLMDRIDVPAVSVSDLIRLMLAEKSADIALRVASARGPAGALCRGRPAIAARFPRKMKFSARGYHSVLKVARTLADLDDKQMVGRINPAEAISYRIAGERLNAATRV
jgi:magnesium chelatase family protein